MGFLANARRDTLADFYARPRKGCVFFERFEAQAIAEARKPRGQGCRAALDERDGERGGEREMVCKRRGIVGACSRRELPIMYLPVRKEK